MARKSPAGTGSTPTEPARPIVVAKTPAAAAPSPAGQPKPKVAPKPPVAASPSLGGSSKPKKATKSAKDADPSLAGPSKSKAAPKPTKSVPGIEPSSSLVERFIAGHELNVASRKASKVVAQPVAGRTSTLEGAVEPRMAQSGGDSTAVAGPSVERAPQPESGADGGDLVAKGGATTGKAPVEAEEGDIGSKKAKKPRKAPKAPVVAKKGVIGVGTSLVYDEPDKSDDPASAEAPAAVMDLTGETDGETDYSEVEDSDEAEVAE